MTLLNTYKRYGVRITHGAGVHVTDDTGQTYLDFYGGHAVAWLGHSHPAITQALTAQAQQLMFYSNVFYHDITERYAERLCATLLPEPYQAYLANSGSEANEAALKVARRFTGKTHIMSFQNSFHGRTMPTLGVTNMAGYDGFLPDFKPYTQVATLGDMASVRAAYDPATTAAVIVEPIQSCGGVHTTSDAFYQALRDWCTETGVLLIFDEVQTGMGRTGQWWYGQHMGVNPDIITSAKAIGNGFPLSACLIRQPIADTIGYGEHGTTYGGGPMAAAVGTAVLDTLQADGLQASVSDTGTYLTEQLLTLPSVTAVHGRGLLLGMEVQNPPEKLTTRCLEAGLIIGGSGRPNVFRLLPPCIITRQHIDEAVSILRSVLT